jgi:hypothetical protein
MNETVHEWIGLPDPTDPAAPHGGRFDVAVDASRLRHIAKGRLTFRTMRAEWPRWLSRSAVDAAATRADAAFEDEQFQNALRTIASDLERWIFGPLSTRR